MVIRTAILRNCRHWYWRDRTPEQIANWQRYCEQADERERIEARKRRRERQPAPAPGDR
jgi:hypothetical protein